MKAILIRHGEKEASFTANPNLTARGFEQAENLAKKVMQKMLFEPQALWASERVRSQQTLAALAMQSKIKLEIRADLNERSSSESRDNFTARVRATLKELSHLQKDVIFCTHYDWVEEALIALPCDTDLLSSEYVRWSPGQYMLFDIGGDGLWKLEEFSRL